jgi:hypothetical protein
MGDGDWLGRRLRPYSRPAGAPLRPGAFRERPAHGTLRERVAARVDDAVERFELDRLLYDIEVDALNAWVRRMVAFDAYCAKRGRQPGG